MKNLVLLVALSISVVTFSSCSSRRSSGSSDKGITSLKPTTGRPSTSVINASGDGLTPGVNPHNRTTGSSKEQATTIANNAISKASSIATTRMLILDTLSASELINRLSVSNKRQIKITTIAQKEGENQKIKDYASMIIKDHQQLQTQLDKLSASALTGPSNFIVTRLKAHSPSAQHRNTGEYIQMTIEEHQIMIRLLEAASTSNEVMLSDFAAKHLNLLKAHLSAAQDLTKK